MKVQEVISKLKVMLGAETEVVETIEAKFAEATLVDGTVVTTEGEIVEGAILKVAVEEGEAPFAPEGLHETQEGLLITVGENGEIISIEEKAPEETLETEEVIEEEMEEEVKIEEETKEEVEIGRAHV